MCHFVCELISLIIQKPDEKIWWSGCLEELLFTQRCASSVVVSEPSHPINVTFIPRRLLKRVFSVLVRFAVTQGTIRLTWEELWKHKEQIKNKKVNTVLSHSASKVVYLKLWTQRIITQSLQLKIVFLFAGKSYLLYLNLSLMIST